MSLTTEADDRVLPFHIDGADVRGRLVRLGPALDAILTAHAYPRPVQALLGEAVTLSALLAGMLKYEGVFTLQIRGAGPVDLLVCDATSGGDLRGYARFDADAPDLVDLSADAAAAARRDADVARQETSRLLGKGHLAFTVDQGAHTQRYQGVVALDGPTLVDCVHHYFDQSEQLRARFRVAVGEALSPGGGGGWRAGGVAVQKLPPATTNYAPEDGPPEDEGFNRARILMESATADELLDPAPAPDRLLYRLFHEDGVRVFPAAPLSQNCRCSRGKLLAALARLPAADRAEIAEPGAVEVQCEFCNTEYVFTPDELESAADASPE
ncbi:MAG: Hsp33 family molecular chaperone HslO [Pseudomonadota bacterium]